MGLRCCSSYPARKLFHVELTIVNTVQREDLIEGAPHFPRLEGERRRRFVAQLNSALREIDCTAIQSARRAGLESSYIKSKLPKVLAQA